MIRDALLAVTLGLAAASAQAAPDGATIFARCAACHMQAGEGAPGSFPPLRAQVTRYARTGAGREYMVGVVTHGLAGAIRVAGQKFDGFMPAQPLTADEAAAVLSFVANQIAGASPPVRPFATEEVAALRSRLAAASAQDIRDLRPDALADPAR